MFTIASCFPSAAGKMIWAKEKKKGSSRANVLQNKGVFVRRQGVPGVKIQPCPTCRHYSCSALLKREQRQCGGDMGQLCLPAVPACSSASYLPAEPGKADEDQAETVFQSCKVIFLPVFSVMLRHPNLAALQHKLAAGRTSHLHPQQLTMLQCCSLSGGKV